MDLICRCPKSIPCLQLLGIFILTQKTQIPSKTSRQVNQVSFPNVFSYAKIWPAPKLCNIRKLYNPPTKKNIMQIIHLFIVHLFWNLPRFLNIFHSKIPNLRSKRELSHADVRRWPINILMQTNEFSDLNFLKARKPICEFRVVGVRTKKWNFRLKHGARFSDSKLKARDAVATLLTHNFHCHKNIKLSFFRRFSDSPACYVNRGL